MMNISTGISAESQIDFDLVTPQVTPIDKPLQLITSKDSSTKTIGEGKKIFIYIIQSLKDYINSLQNQLKDIQIILDWLFNRNRNHQEQKLAENVKGLPTSTNDIIKVVILTNSNKDALKENHHVLENNNKSNLNRRRQIIKKWQHRR